jgi:hypothetical protein
MAIEGEEAASVMAADVAPLAERRAPSAPLVSAHRDRIRRTEGSGRTATVQALAAVSAADAHKGNRAAPAANAAAESTLLD